MSDDKVRRSNIWINMLGVLGSVSVLGFIGVIVYVYFTFPNLLFSSEGAVVVAILGASTFLFMFACRVKRRKHKHILYLLSACIVLFPASLILYFMLFLNPFQDDGPFIGTVRKDCPSTPPQQTFHINLGRTLEVFDPQVGEPAPTVLLRKHDKTIAWCVFASGHDGTYVHKLSFSSYSEATFSKSVKLIGSVSWTFGQERMTWTIDEDNSYAYWYSW